LRSALAEVGALDRDVPTATFVVSGEQWQRSCTDAGVDDSLIAYTARRAEVYACSRVTGADIGRRLRPAALALAHAANDVCGRLELLAVQSPADGAAARAASDWRNVVVEDVVAVLSATVHGADLPNQPNWPALPTVADDGADVLMAAFGVPSAELVDATGAFSSTRLLAAYRMRLPALQHACDRILSLVGERPPMVFSGAGLARDVITSVSPFVTLAGARQIRRTFLDVFERDSERASNVLAASWNDVDREWSSFDRLADRLRRADSAETDRERCIALLEAYKHMAEGLTRRWTWSLLQLTGLEGDAPTVGQLSEPAAARLGSIGARLERGLIVAARNAEAHEDFEFDEGAGVLRAGEAVLTEHELLEALKELDVLQRAWVVGRACALEDAPDLPSAAQSRTTKASARFRVEFASHRFGHAGQTVRSFRRNRQRVDIELDGLRAEACNPCFVALVQSAAVFPDVSRFVVRVRGRPQPIIDLPSSVLRENWPVFVLAAHLFPHSLPQSTFVPSLTWVRRACESLDEATRVAAWLVLNDAQHAVNDAEANPVEAVVLIDRLRIAGAAGRATIPVLPDGPHLKPLNQAVRIIESTADGLLDGARDVSGDILIDRILRVRDRLGPRPAILPTLDLTPLPEGEYPHAVS
jgi:hypothetical protein